MLTKEKTLVSKAFLKETNFYRTIEEQPALDIIEMNKPLNEVKNIKSFLEIIFEALQDKGTFKFHYNHRENKKLSFKNFRNIISFVIFPLGLIPFNKRAISDSKLSDLLISCGFEITEVNISNKYFYYTARKDVSLKS